MPPTVELDRERIWASQDPRVERPRIHRVETRRMSVGNWEFKVGESRQLADRAIGDIRTRLLPAFVLASVPSSPEDRRTAIERVYGLPSCLIRIDMSVASLMDTSSTLEESFGAVYEIEARPAGIGIFLRVAGEEGRKDLVQMWREQFNRYGCGGFKVLPSVEGRMADTQLGAELLGFPFFGPYNGVPSGDLFWVRGGLADPKATEFDKVALAPVSGHGDKTYLVSLGLAGCVEDISGLPWDEGFVVKPSFGSKMHDVEIYLPTRVANELYGGKVQGLSTRTRVERVLREGRERGGAFLYQPFVSPLVERLVVDGEERDWFTIARIFFGFDNVRNDWIFMGGLWNSRPTLRVHGASDAILGLILPDNEG